MAEQVLTGKNKIPRSSYKCITELKEKEKWSPVERLAILVTSDQQS